MLTTNSSDDQNLFDIALQMSGNLDSVMQLVLNNSNVSGINDRKLSGKQFTGNTPTNSNAVWFNSNQIIPASKYPISISVGDYNADYSNDFNVI